MNVYLPTGNSSARRANHIRALERMLPNGFKQEENSFLIMGGDFNFVDNSFDRIQRFTEDGFWRNAPQAGFENDETPRSEFQLIRNSLGISEVQHENYTWSSGINEGRGRNGLLGKYKTLSRLDRFYLTDSAIVAASTNTKIKMIIIDGDISDHNPLAITISNNKRKNSSKEKNPSIKEWVYRNPDFVELVNREFDRTNNPNENVWLQLSNLCEAMYSAQELIKRYKKRDPAETVDEKLAILNAIIHSMQSGCLEAQRAISLMKQLPELGGLLIQRETDAGIRTTFDRVGIEKLLRNLTREKINTELEEIEKHGKISPDFEFRKMGIMDRLSGLKPGGKQSIQCVWDAGKGSFVTEDEEIAEAVHPKFQSMFESSNKPIEDIRSFVGEFPKRINCEWSISNEDISRVLRQSNKSHPGPGGIPFEAFRILGTTATKIIKKIIDNMTSEHPTEIPEEWTKCLLFLVPKSSDMVTEEGMPAFSCGKIRPVMVSASIIRIISKCLLEVLMPRVLTFIHQDQRGFVRNRDIMENVYDLHEFFWKNQGNKKGSAMAYVMLVDFSNAFSSIDWGFMREVLLHIGIPVGWANAFLSFLKTKVDLNFRGFTKENYVDIGAGCRQGDPLSGILFAIFLEPLLWKLRTLDGTKALGFADDLGLELSRLTIRKFRQICQIFCDFEKASNLKVNRGKTHWIACKRKPTHRNFETDKKRFTCDLWPGFEDQFSAQETYLGVPFGIKVTRKTACEQAVDKFREARRRWEKVPLNHANRAFAANIFMGSFFGYISQIYPITKKIGNEINSQIKSFVYKIPFLKRDIFFGIPAILGFETGHFPRDTYLWSVASFIRATRYLVISDHHPCENKRSLFQMLTSFRNMFTESTGLPFPNPGGGNLNVGFKELGNQTMVYKKLYKHTYDTTEIKQGFIDAMTRAHPSITDAGANRIIRCIKALYLQKGKDVEQGGPDWTRPSGSFKIHRFHIFNLIKLLCNGVPTKVRMSWRIWGDHRCRFCGDDQDSIEHWLGSNNTPKCSSLVRATELCKIPVNSRNILTDENVTAYHLFFWSAVMYTYNELHSAGFSNGDPEGHSIKAWFQNFVYPCEKKTSKKPRIHLETDELNKPWIQHKYTGISGESNFRFFKLSHIRQSDVWLVGCKSPCVQSVVNTGPDEILLFVTGTVVKQDEEVSGAYAIIGFGIQHYPVTWCGSGVAGSTFDQVVASTVGIHKILEEIRLWNPLRERSVSETIRRIRIIIDSRKLFGMLGPQQGKLPKNDPDLSAAVLLASDKISKLNNTILNHKLKIEKIPMGTLYSQIGKKLAQVGMAETKTRQSAAWVGYSEHSIEVLR